MVVVAIALLCASLSPLVQGMPLSWSRSSRHRRSVQTGTSPTEPTVSTENAGTVLQQTPLDTGLGGGGAGNSTTDLFNQCIEECYNKVLPRDQIEKLRESISSDFLVRGVHPAFLLSQWLENHHQYMFCRERNVTLTGCEDSNRQTVNGTVTDITRVVNETLGHTVAYDEQRYPRYTVHVNCANSQLKDMHYLEKKSDGQWQRKIESIPVCTGENQSSSR